MTYHSMYILVYILQSLREKILALIQDQHSESVDNKVQSHATVHFRLTDIFVNKAMLPLNDVTL